MESEKEILEIRKQIATCTKCKLYLSRNKIVPGEGPVNCEIMFIGEAPGFHENEQGKPFVGAAGQFLDTLLEKAGLKRENVFITNVVKCRPPANREPEAEELDACRPYLEAQITAIDPKVIVTLGRFSMANFIENGKISFIHGHSRMINGRLIVPMYHPAAALHQPDLRNVLLEDFSRLPALLDKKDNISYSETKSQTSTTKAAEIEEEPKKEQAQQLSLFE
jgi:uracil-DNA glycosylase family 4